MFTWFAKLIRNNTGVSAKNFFLVIVTFIGCLLLLVPAFTLTLEAVMMHTIATDLTGFAAYIGAVGSLFATAGLTKAWSERYEHHNHRVADNFEGSPDENSAAEDE